MQFAERIPTSVSLPPWMYFCRGSLARPTGRHGEDCTYIAPVTRSGLPRIYPRLRFNSTPRGTAFRVRHPRCLRASPSSRSCVPVRGPQHGSHSIPNPSTISRRRCLPLLLFHCPSGFARSLSTLQQSWHFSVRRHPMAFAKFLTCQRTPPRNPSGVSQNSPGSKLPYPVASPRAYAPTRSGAR